MVRDPSALDRGTLSLQDVSTRVFLFFWLSIILTIILTSCSSGSEAVPTARPEALPTRTPVHRPAGVSATPPGHPSVQNAVPIQGRLLIATTRFSGAPESDLPVEYRLAWLSQTGIQPIPIPGDSEGVTDAAVEPDGQSIVVILGANQVKRVSANGKTAKDIMSVLPSMNVIQPSAYLSVAWAGQRQVLVHQTYPGGLFFLNLDTSDLHLLPHTGIAPAVSPNGQEIALGYVTTEPFYCIYLADRQLKSFRKLTKDVVTESAPAWSPDGQWIAYAANPGLGDAQPTSAWEVRVIRPDGSGEQVVLPRQDGRSYPTIRWSPDATRLAVTYYDAAEHRRQIGIINRNGGGLHVLSDPTANDIALGWVR